MRHDDVPSFIVRILYGAVATYEVTHVTVSSENSVLDDGGEGVGQSFSQALRSVIAWRTRSAEKARPISARATPYDSLDRSQIYVTK